MAKKFLNNIDLNGTLTIAGSGGTNGYFLSTNGSGVISWAAASGGSFTGGTLTSSLTLRSGTATAATAPLYFGNSTPAVLTTAVQGAVEYDGVAFYATPNSASRGLLPASQHYLVGTAYTTDWSTTAAISGLGGKKLTIVPGVYEFEGAFFVSTPGGPTSSYATNFRLIYTTVTGTNAVNSVGYEFMAAGNTTTSYTTAATPTILYQTTFGTSNTVTSAVTSATKYAIIKVKGSMRVSGTGTATFAPAFAITAVDAANSVNAVTINPGSWFTVTPVATYSASTDVSIGAWA